MLRIVSQQHPISKVRGDMPKNILMGKYCSIITGKMILNLPATNKGTKM